MDDEYCWEKYGDLLRLNLEWFMKRGRYYRRTPWMHIFFEKYLRGKVLDLGCGYASTSRYYLSNKKNIERLILVDIVEEVFRDINDHPGLLKILSDALSLPFNNDYFDTVFMQAFLHNIPGKECRIYLLRNIWRVLRNKGILIITVWAPDLIVLGKKYLLRKISENDIIIEDKWGKRYYHLYSLDELVGEVSIAGFSVIEYDYIIQNMSSPDLTRNIILVALKNLD